MFNGDIELEIGPIFKYKILGTRVLHPEGESNHLNK